MKRLWRACRSSWDGLRWALGNELSFQQEVAVFVVGVPLAFLISESGGLRIALVGSLLLILIAELLNTSLEALSDHVTPERSEAIKVVKDSGSAAVLLAMVLAGMIWIYALIDRL